MNLDLEKKFIERFLIKEKKERYLTFVKKEKTRNKLLNELYHFKDFNWKLFKEIKSSENEREVILKKITTRKNIDNCYVISVDQLYDGKMFSVHQAIEEIVGVEGTILIFGEIEVVYYEAETFDGRYISL